MAAAYIGSLKSFDKSGVIQFHRISKDGSSFWMEHVGGERKLAHPSITTKDDVPREVFTQFHFTGSAWVD